MLTEATEKYSNTVKLKYYYNSKYLFSVLLYLWFYSFDGKSEFSASLLQSLVSHDHADMLIC